MPLTTFDMQAMPMAIPVATGHALVAFVNLRNRPPYNTGQSRVVELIMHLTLRDSAEWPLACSRPSTPYRPSDSHTGDSHGAVIDIDIAPDAHMPDTLPCAHPRVEELHIQKPGAPTVRLSVAISV